MIFYESFSNSYYKLGEKVGKAWSEGKVFMEPDPDGSPALPHSLYTQA